MPERPRGELAVHPAAPAARPARRHRGVRRHGRRSRSRSRRRHGRDRRPRRRPARRGRRARRPGRRRGVVGVPRGHRRRRSTARPSRSRSPSPGRGRAPPPSSHLQLRTAPHAEATVVLTHSGSGTLADNLEVVVGRRRRGSRWSSPRSGPTTPCTSARSTSRSAATPRCAPPRWRWAATWCGSAPRSTTAVPAATPSCSASGFADAGQHLEQRLLVDHAVPNCKSNVLYKNALQGDGARTRCGSATC